MLFQHRLLAKAFNLRSSSFRSLTPAFTQAFTLLARLLITRARQAFEQSSYTSRALARSHQPGFRALKLARLRPLQQACGVSLGSLGVGAGFHLYCRSLHTHSCVAPARRFVTRAELEKLALGHLLGTPLLRAYMHGYFVDNRLYRKAKVPFI